MAHGGGIPIIRDGEVDHEVMRKKRIDSRTLRENLRLQGKCSDPSSVAQAVYERNGSISVIPKDDGEAHVVEVNVEDGVQTVRIEISR